KSLGDRCPRASISQHPSQQHAPASSAQACAAALAVSRASRTSPLFPSAIDAGIQRYLSPSPIWPTLLGARAQSWFPGPCDSWIGLVFPSSLPLLSLIAPCHSPAI